MHIRSDNVSGVETIFDVHTDHLSTPRLVTDPSESVVWRASYASFGEASVDPSSTLVLNVRFPGQYLDDETGLHYNRYRYYQSSVGRYMSADPVGQWGGVSLYAYVRNNPVRAVDLLGLSELEVDRSDETMLVYPGDGQGGRAQGPPQQFPASNNARAGVDPHLPEANGRAPYGTFDVGTMMSTASETPDSPLGDRGFIPIDLRTTDANGNRFIGPIRGGVGIHAGRVGRCDQAGRCDERHATNGCIRTTPEAMDALAADPPTKIKIQP